MNKRKLLTLAVALCMVLTLLPAPRAIAAGANTSIDTAISIQPGVPFTVEGTAYSSYWYSFTTDKAGQYVYLTADYPPGVDTDGRVSLYDSRENVLDNIFFSTGNVISAPLYIEEPGTYYLAIRFTSEATRAEFSFRLQDNDDFEPNNTPAAATPLANGQTAAFSLTSTDRDHFAVQTTADGQDIALTFSGFSHDNQGSLYLTVNGFVKDIFSNGTVYFHAPKAGTYVVRLGGSSTQYQPLLLSLTVNLLSDDGNEPNDTKESYTYLPIGTDASFRLGGLDDEDWFAFEAALEPEASQTLYTLNFLDLNPDYSDKLCYDVYAPNGTAVITDAQVNIRHANVLACTQTGLYYIRIHNGDIYKYNSGMDMTRSLLRIRVEEGGADPYEGNDHWTEAAAVSTGAPIQFILANTVDVDWFKFEVPQADMTLKLAADSRIAGYLFDSATLQELGPGSGSYATNYLSSFSTVPGSYRYYKFTSPGVYYLRATTESSYISADLRNLTLSLLPATAEEHNDSYLTATPLFEGVPQSYTVSAGNDDDWFSIEVPAGVTQLLVDATSMSQIFSKRDFDFIGINAPALAEGYRFAVNDPAPGTYYVRANSSEGYELPQTISYALLTDTLGGGENLNTAVPLPLGQWIKTAQGGFRYYSLGALKAGDEVRIYAENLENFVLYNSAGSRIYSFWADDNPNYLLRIPADDTYTIAFNIETYGLDAASRPYLGRLLVDIGHSPVGSATIEGLPAALTLEVGERFPLFPRIAPYEADLGSTVNGQLFSCSTDRYSTCFITRSSGEPYQIVGNAVGNATVTVSLLSSLGSGVSTSVDIPVTVVAPGSRVPATALTITNAPADMSIGQRVELAVDVQPINANETVVWSSSDPSVLHVNSFGSVTAVGSGTAIITARTAAGVMTQAQINVAAAADKVPVSSITLSDYDMTLYAGESATALSATVNPANADYSGIVWISSNVNAATVDQQGNVTPVAPGIAVITAAAGDYKASCIVTVQAARIRVEGITFDSNRLELPMGGRTTLLPIITPADATVQNVTWYSSDEAVAVVSRTGIVTALAVGECTITATTVDRGLTASITISVTAAPQLGDINMDGYVDSGDALMTLRYAVGAITLTAEQMQVADVNKDGFVDAGDAIRILRYDAGLISKL